MSGPRINVERGSPTPEEEAAINAAILKIWRDDVAAAARGGGEEPWVLAARAAAMRVPMRDAGGEHAWRLSYRLDGGNILHRRMGAGGAR